MAQRGVFWVIDDELMDDHIVAEMFVEGASVGLSKSGTNYNHKLLWEHVKPPGCNKPYDYYPRGRVEISNKGKPVIYMNKNIDGDVVERVLKIFHITEYPRIHYDGSEHYKCHLDRDLK